MAPLFTIFAFLVASASAGSTTTKITPKGVSENESVKSMKLPPCAACKVLTDSFKKVSTHFLCNISSVCIGWRFSKTLYVSDGTISEFRHSADTLFYY